MGVMACDRAGCDNVMCDHYSEAFGYICYDCKKELIETRGETTIGEFMRKPKSKLHNSSDPYAWGSYVERIFEDIN